MENLFTYWKKLNYEVSQKRSISDDAAGPSVNLEKVNSDESAKVSFKNQYIENVDDEDSAELSSMFSKLNTEQRKTKLQQQQQQQQPEKQQNISQNNLSFLTAFHEALVEVQKNSSSVESNEPTQPMMFTKKTSSPRDYYFDDNTSTNIINSNAHSPTNTSVISSLGSIHRQRTKQSSFSNTSNLTTLMTSNNSNTNTMLNKKIHTNKELLLSKNFPFFRRIYNFNIHNSNFLLKTKLYLQTQLSPDLTKLVLLSEKKWEVYSLDTEKPEKAPKLLCCGKSDGSYGTNFDHLKKIKKDQIISNSNITSNINDALSILENWEHLYCQITENYLFISGTRGFLRIIDLNQTGRCVINYQCNFPIRCFDVSPDEKFIALGITGKDKYTQVEQAVIILLKIIPETSKFPFQISACPFTLPYRDPIGILKFSADSKLLSVATVLESRFLVISLADPSRPTLVMKSQRRLDTSLDSEGITDMSFFPDNRLMTITSLSPNSEPIIIDTNIASISGPDGIAKPKLLMKIDEVGSTIHKCCVSPRGDSVAYLNRNGNVYIMTAPRMDDNDSKRIACVLEVSNAARVKEAASMRFDADGYKLYVIDRKGVLSIADFTAGTVEDHTVTRCKIIS
jgi:hypothetical protein